MWANVSESKLLHKRPRRNCLLAYDYFKDPVAGTFPPTAWANIRIAMSWRVRFVPHDDRSIPPVTANRTWRLTDSFLQLFQPALECHGEVSIPAWRRSPK